MVRLIIIVSFLWFSGWSCQTSREQCESRFLLSDEESYQFYQCVSSRERKWATPKSKTISVISWGVSSDGGVDQPDLFSPPDLPVERNVNLLLRRVRR